MPRIAASVGPSQPNFRGDVRTVQVLLNRKAASSSASELLVVDGVFGAKTEARIVQFQLTHLQGDRPDGTVDVDGPTLRKLSFQAFLLPPKPSHNPKPTAPGAKDADGSHTARRFVHSQDPNPGGLTEDQYVDAAKALRCEASAVKAVVQTEVAIRGPFDNQGRATILFERHYFHKLTNGRFDGSSPDISNPVPGGYGRFSAQYDKLARAIILDRQAALRSASWGAFQIMGDNYRLAGFASIDAFVTAMNQSTATQVAAFVAFVKNSPKILSAIRTNNWTSFASHYNGPAYQKNKYDSIMRGNYERFAKHP